MSDITFSRLTDLSLREAWQNEAGDFTPWLAENIDQLGAAVGMELELTGQEVAVERFSADLLARNPQDGSVVLIENQLEATDHTHLGQIMTYLAGLEAQTVIWIAPRFRAPHLSAIRWLNEQTAEGFAFLAVRLRVVRIGDSPLAPIFELEEQPNDWEREIRQQVAKEGASYYDVKQRFWAHLLDAHPELERLGVRAWRYPNNYITVCEEPRINLSIWIGRTHSGVFVRSAWGEPSGPVSDTLAPYRETLERVLGASLGPSGRDDRFLACRRPKGHEHEQDWPETMAWMNDMITTYRAAFAQIARGADT